MNKILEGYTKEYEEVDTYFSNQAKKVKSFDYDKDKIITLSDLQDEAKAKAVFDFFNHEFYNSLGYLDKVDTLKSKMLNSNDNEKYRNLIGKLEKIEQKRAYIKQIKESLEL